MLFPVLAFESQYEINFPYKYLSFLSPFPSINQVAPQPMKLLTFCFLMDSMRPTLSNRDIDSAAEADTW